VKNWKTTLVAWLTGAGYMILQGFSQGLKPKDVLLGTGVALLGTLAKDFNVTGGKVPQ